MFKTRVDRPSEWVPLSTRSLCNSLRTDLGQTANERVQANGLGQSSVYSFAVIGGRWNFAVKACPRQFALSTADVTH